MLIIKKNVSISDNSRLLWSRRFVYTLNVVTRKIRSSLNIRSCGHDFTSWVHDIRISWPRHNITFPWVNMTFSQINISWHNKIKWTEDVTVPYTFIFCDLVLAGSLNPEILALESCFLQTINQKLPINTLKLIHTSNNNQPPHFWAFHTVTNPRFLSF